MAAAIRPIAQHILATQERADRAHYNDRFDSGRQMASEMERIDPRGELPPVPTLDPGGDPDVWREQRAVVDRPDVPDELEPTLVELEDQQLQELDDDLVAKARREKPEWYAQDGAWRSLEEPSPPS